MLLGHGEGPVAGRGGWSWGLTLTPSWSPTAVPGEAGAQARQGGPGFLSRTWMLCVASRPGPEGRVVREGHPPASQAPTLPAEAGVGSWRGPHWRAAVSLDPRVRGWLRPPQPGPLCLLGTRKFIRNGTDGLKWNREN